MKCKNCHNEESFKETLLALVSSRCPVCKKRFLYKNGIFINIILFFVLYAALQVINTYIKLPFVATILAVMLLWLTLLFVLERVGILRREYFD